MTTVNYFHNLQSGAPQLDGLAGSGISVLDAALVNGWGLQTATIAVSGGVATLTTPAPHVFESQQVALIAGATPPSGLNGRKRVLSRTSSTITFAAPGEPDGAATGAITVVLAPAGWEKVFSGTNKAVYRAPATPDGCRMYLRVDDTVGRNMRVVGYETMGDVDTGDMPFPTGGQLSGGGWWPKSNAASSAARAWTVVADDRTMYVCLGSASNTGASGRVYGFGDFTSYKAGDAYGAFLARAESDLTTNTTPAGGSNAVDAVSSTQTDVTISVPRSFSGLGSAVAAIGQVECHVSNSVHASGAGFGQVTTYPNGPNNGLMLVRRSIAEPGVCQRGVLRGVYLAPQNCHASFDRNTQIDGSGDTAGRKLMAVKCGSVAGTTNQGVVFFDITGPW
jgi:hypothetical protein